VVGCAAGNEGVSVELLERCARPGGAAGEDGDEVAEAGSSASCHVPRGAWLACGVLLLVGWAHVWEFRLGAGLPRFLL
jgi:hypothetical protein